MGRGFGVRKRKRLNDIRDQARSRRQMIWNKMTLKKRVWLLKWLSRKVYFETSFGSAPSLALGAFTGNSGVVGSTSAASRGRFCFRQVLLRWLYHTSVRASLHKGYWLDKSCQWDTRHIDTPQFLVGGHTSEPPPKYQGALVLQEHLVLSAEVSRLP